MVLVTCTLMGHSAVLFKSVAFGGRGLGSNRTLPGNMSLGRGWPSLMWVPHLRPRDGWAALTPEVLGDSRLSLLPKSPHGASDPRR